MVELVPIHSSVWDCYEDCIHTLCHSIDINPIHMFSRTWNFTILPLEGGLDTWMECQKQIKLELLEAYRGITLQAYASQDIEQLKELCKQEIPIIVGTDLYDLPWSDYYQRIHAPHACMVVGYDTKKHEFAFIDPTIMKKDIYLRESMLTNIYTYELMTMSDKGGEPDYMEMLKISLESFHAYAVEKDAFEDMKRYATNIIPHIVAQNILKTHPLNPLDHETLRHVLFTSRGRLTYAQWLQYIGNQKGHAALLEISKKMQGVGLKWQNLRMKLMRGIYQDNLLKIQAEIENYILGLVQEEEGLYQTLMQYCKHTELEEQNELEGEWYEGKDYKAIALKEYFNHQAFYAQKLKNKKEGFDGEGYFYINPIEKTNVLDHVICEGQRITTKPHRCSGIQITASASKGHYIEEVTVVFEDDSTQVISIGFSDWWETEPLCGEKIAWTGKCGKIENEELVVKGRVNIFVNDYRLDREKSIKTIILPDNPNLHIFKIALITPRNVLVQGMSSRAREKIAKEEVNYWEAWEEKITDIAKADTHRIIYTNGCDTNKVAITFDDAPDAITTPQILKILKDYGVKATFSVIGCYFEACGGLLKNMKEDGHQIVNHTWNHKHLSTCEKEEIRNELEKTQDAICNLIGEKPLFMRPPYGDFNDCVKQVVFEEKLNMVLWSYNTFDWAATCKEDILENMVENIRGGEIILMHSYENKQPTIDSLSELIEKLNDRGFEMVTVAELLNSKAYKY